jgi:hypothetical protein
MTGMDEPEEGSVVFSTPQEEFEAARTVWLSRNPGRTEADFSLTQLREWLFDMTEFEDSAGWLLRNDPAAGSRDEYLKPVIRAVSNILNLFFTADGLERPWWADPDPEGFHVYRITWSAAEVAAWLGGGTDD